MDHLKTEARNPASTNLDELTPLQLVQLMNQEDGKVIAAVASQAEAIARAIEQIAQRLQAGGRLIYAGAGTSGRLGVLDATECPPTFNSPPGQVIGIIAGGATALTQAVEGAEDRPELAGQDLQALGLNARDVLVGIATSGRTPYVLGAVEYARSQGAYTIGLACNPESDLEARVDLAITPVVGPEVLSGSTRLKAGTATKLVLNMLSTGAMVCLGKTFGNLMVDLRATNSKLRARANRIVRTLTGLPVEQAETLLQQCAGELKTALVAQRAGVTPQEARTRLEAVGGQVSKALRLTAKAEPVDSAPAPVSGLYLGVDGGGSHSVALLAVGDKGDGSRHSARWQLLGRGQAGPSNLQAIGTGPALAALEEAIAGAFAAAGRPLCPVAGACLGLAGAGRDEDQKVILDWARRVNLAGNVIVTTDAALLPAAGTPEGWGLAVVAGTGSIVYGQTADGRTARAGGWGYLLGDEGSGYALVLAALQAVARAADARGPTTSLTERILNRMGLARPQQLVPAVYRGSWDRAALAALAPLVLEAAEGCDGVAEEIVNRQALELAHTAAAVARQLGFDQGTVPLALAGGALLASPGYQGRFVQALRSLGVQPGPIKPVAEPAEGAVWLALLGQK
jgi:N-acetylmuramic acid 6-phosphate etherase